MSIFCSKKLSSPVLLGEKLRTTRENNGLNLDDFSLKIGVPKKYLSAIEENNFSALPAEKTFRLAYLRAYISALNISPQECIKQFEKEGGFRNIKTSNIPTLKNIGRFNFYSPSIILRNSFLAILILTFAVYLGWQIKGIMQQPELLVFSPIEGAVSNNIGVKVQGQSEKEAQLTVNGQDIMINDKGQFEATVDLSNGVNTITISAIKKHGRTTTVTRHVVVKSSEGEKVSLKN